MCSQPLLLFHLLIFFESVKNKQLKYKFSISWDQLINEHTLWKT